MPKIIIYLVKQEHNALLQLAQREMRVPTAMPREISLKNPSLQQPCADGMFRPFLPFSPWRINFKKVYKQNNPVERMDTLLFDMGEACFYNATQ